MLNMKKHKNTSSSHNKITTIFGYSLFALMVVSFLATTAIPFSFTLQYPTARHFNIVVMIVAFAIAVILPALASYFIGDRATHSKNKALHHYNGVLFGVAAYWVAMVFSWIGFNSIFGMSLPFPGPLVITNVTPVVLTILVMVIIAARYAKKQKNVASVLHYRPYQLVLIASVIGAFFVPYISGTVNLNFIASSILWLFVPLIAVGVAYKVLAKRQVTRLARLSDATIAMSLGWITIWVADSFITFLQLPYQIASIPGYVFGLVVFLAYLYLRSRKA